MHRRSKEATRILGATASNLFQHREITVITGFINGLMTHVEGGTTLAALKKRL